ncbi:MAG: hypothetical protein Fur0037_07510 [Planctomycetota bacterium]
MKHTARPLGVSGARPAWRHLPSMLIAASFLASCAAIPSGAPAREDDRGAYPRPTRLYHMRTDAAYVLDPGEVEVVVTGSYLDRPRDRVWSSELEAEYGITDRLMVELGIPFRHYDRRLGRTDTGFGDLEVEAKLALFEEEASAAAAGVELKLPTADENAGLGSGHLGFEAFAATSFQAIESSSTLHIEGGLEFVEGSGFDVAFGNAVVEKRLRGEGTALQFGLNSKFGDGDLRLAVVPGFQIEWELGEGSRPKELEVGLGLPIGVTSESDDFGVVLMFELEI